MALTPEERESLLYGAVIDAIVDGTLVFDKGMVVAPTVIKSSVEALQRHFSSQLSERLRNLLAAWLVESHGTSLSLLARDIATFMHLYNLQREETSLNARPMVRSCIFFRTSRVIDVMGKVHSAGWQPCTQSLDLCYTHHRKQFVKGGLRSLNDALALERFVARYVDKLSRETLVDHVDTMREVLDTGGTSGMTAAAMSTEDLREFGNALVRHGAFDDYLREKEDLAERSERFRKLCGAFGYVRPPKDFILVLDEHRVPVDVTLF